MTLNRIKIDKEIHLESGQKLVNPTIAYHTYGTLNADASNVVWVCHALTGSSNVLEWWTGLFDKGGLFDPEDYFIVCANVLGSHYGTTGPLSVDPLSGEPYYHNFPDITIRDMVQLHIELADYLSIASIAFLLGGSMGGHQAIEWSIMQPDRIDNLYSIASSAVISPWAAAFNQSQRMAIETDPTWEENHDKAGMNGMKVARSLALLSYRNSDIYNYTQNEKETDVIYPTRAASYQEYQGEKLNKRFNAYSYWYLSRAMDSHNIARGRGSIANALSHIKANVVLISMQDDILFPLSDQIEILKHKSSCEHYRITTSYGHDGFLIETDKIAEALSINVQNYLDKKTNRVLIASL